MVISLYWDSLYLGSVRSSWFCSIHTFHCNRVWYVWISINQIMILAVSAKLQKNRPTDLHTLNNNSAHCNISRSSKTPTPGPGILQSLRGFNWPFYVFFRPSNSHDVVVRLTISGLISRSHDLTSKSHGFPQWITTSIRYGLKSTQFIKYAFLLTGNLGRAIFKPRSDVQSEREVPWEGFVSCFQDGGTKWVGVSSPKRALIMAVWTLLGIVSVEIPSFKNIFVNLTIWDLNLKIFVFFCFFVFLIYLFQAQQITTHYLTYTTYEVILILFTIRY